MSRPPDHFRIRNRRFESLSGHRHTAGSQFPTEQQNLGGVNRVVWGKLRSLGCDRDSRGANYDDQTRAALLVVERVATSPNEFKNPFVEFA